MEAEIIRFPGSEEILKARHLSDMLTGLDELIQEGLKITPVKIEALLSVPLNEITIIEDSDDVKKMIFEFIITKADKNHIRLAQDITQATQYLSDLLFRLGVKPDLDISQTLENPYYTYWIEQ